MRCVTGGGGAIIVAASFRAGRRGLLAGAGVYEQENLFMLQSTTNEPTFLFDDLPLHWQMTRWEKLRL